MRRTRKTEIRWILTDDIVKLGGRKYVVIDRRENDFDQIVLRLKPMKKSGKITTTIIARRDETLKFVIR